jgi:hypothetical protein
MVPTEKDERKEEAKKKPWRLEKSDNAAMVWIMDCGPSLDL